MTNKNKQHKKYWYEFYEQECVLCGHYDVYKERRYTEKPKEYYDRHHLEQYACQDHF